MTLREPALRMRCSRCGKKAAAAMAVAAPAEGDAEATSLNQRVQRGLSIGCIVAQESKVILLKTLRNSLHSLRRGLCNRGRACA